ncbi:MAG TPA: 2-oxoacid:acceptor oxidoreductase [Ruminococcaceae bacterium]|nr:2-oxoacid:acceptor oxidoreductase [Oscillospiraceae bacterium]
MKQNTLVHHFQVLIDEECCKGCGLCVTACPKQILELIPTRLNRKGYHPAHVTDIKQCIGCTSCAIMCPDIAIVIEGQVE